MQRSSTGRMAIVIALVFGMIVAAQSLRGRAMAADQAGPPDLAGFDASRLLKKKLWIIETRAAPGARPTPQQMRAHMEHQVDIEKAGVLFAAGPVTSGDDSYGMIVIRAGSREEARRIADSDPLHSGGLRKYVLKEWQINEGRVSVQLNFSDGSYRFD